MRNARHAPLLLALIFCASGPVAGQNLTIGTPAPVFGNCSPFICFAYLGGTQFQQIYAASAFGPAPVDIFGLYFFNRRSSAQAGHLDGSTYRISLSTVGTSIAGFVGNNGPIPVGSNSSDIFSGVIGGPLNIGIALHLAYTPFLYDPAQGNLLMNVDVLSSSGIPFTPNDAMDALDPNPCTETARAWAYGAGGGAQCGGALFTGFDVSSPVSVTPEPASLALLATGLAGLGVLAKRCRRRLGR